MRRVKPGQTPPIIFVMIGGVVLILVVFVAAIGGGGGNNGISTPPVSADRSVPERVHERVVIALQNNSPDAVYNELSPSLQQSLTLESFRKSDAESNALMGKIIKVEILNTPEVLTGTGWDGKWAQSKVKITREKAEEIYVARFFLENGKWYLVATIKVP